MEKKVLTIADVALDNLVSLLGQYGLDIVVHNDGEPITGSFWGDAEAGIVRNTVYVRGDTPVHSVLHESCHVVCMTPGRRARLNRDAGGDDLEESSVCYLQILLADFIIGVGRERLMQDMDTWGYSFRLGSTREWFYRDAHDASQFLINQNLMTEGGEPTFVLRS